VSALSLPARREKDASGKPLPWRRMVWVTWRQHRLGLVGVWTLLLVLAFYVSLVGRQLRHAFAAAIACQPASSIACTELARRYNDMNLHLANGFVWQPLPALIGAFLGAPVLARELETGTFRYTWTQGFGRLRWTLAKLMLLGLAVVASTAAFSVLLSWYYRPYFLAGHQTAFFSQFSPLSAGLFDLRGVAFAAWTLIAFAIGALAGALIGRVIPAIVATLVTYTGLALLAALFLRRHYMAPLLTAKPNLSATALIVSQWWTQGSRFAFRGLPPMNLIQQFCPPSAVGSGKPSPGTLAQCLAQHGYTLWSSYQPASRFWAYQGIEGAWLLVLSAILIGLTVSVARHRAA
jgi:ABC-type transport system involved in multi-copper enzyme maturation permease subunit